MEPSSDTQEVEHDLPLSLLPDLEEYGILPLDRGICEDSYENRNILRANKLRWRELYNDDGSPSDRILVISQEMEQARALRKGGLYEEPGDTNSDYLTGSLLLMAEDVESKVPAWVLSATRKWIKVERERENSGNPYFAKYLEQAPGRCVASRSDGHRCRNWHNGTRANAGMCKVHLGRHGTPQVNTLDKARNRARSIAVRAVDELEALLDSATSEPVRLKAATEILDRIGIRAGIDIDQNVNIEVRPARDMIENRLKRLSVEKLAEEAAHPDELPVLEAEVVKHDE